MVSTHECDTSGVGAAPQNHELVYAFDFHGGEINGGDRLGLRSCLTGPPPEWEEAGGNLVTLEKRREGEWNGFNGTGETLGLGEEMGPNIMENLG
jgi:hypothetical protein